MMPARRFLILIVLSLAACSGDSSWFGGEDKPPLPGKRIPVMLLERQLAADPRLSTLPIRLPPPVVNPDWPQAGGVASHAMHHLAAKDNLKLAWSADIGTGTRRRQPAPGAAGGRRRSRLHDGRRRRDQRVRRR